MSRNTFLSKVQKYIGSDAWAKRIIEEYEKHEISDIPQKIGKITESGKVFADYLINHPNIIGHQSLPYVVIFLENDIIQSNFTLRFAKGKTIDDKFSNWDQSDQQIARAIQISREALKYMKYLRNLKYRKK